MFDKLYVVVDAITNRPQMAFEDRGEALAAIGALCPGDSPERRVAEVPMAWCQDSGMPGGMLASLLCGETDE